MSQSIKASAVHASDKPEATPPPRRFKNQAEPSSLKPADYPNVISPAHINWQTDDSGNQVPISGEFGDVYFSHADGLAESRHVFLDGNRLPERLKALSAYDCFTVAELGFGTGLNALALWQLWRQVRLENPTLATARLHLITTEKHPIPFEDLTQILTLWAQRAPELAPFIEPLLTAYPPLIAGCHRLNFIEDNFTIDIWLGNASDSLVKLSTNTVAQIPPHIDAWFLDGFAPSCNESLWADGVFVQMQRLSHAGTTAATYSCAGVVKRGLQTHGFEIKKTAGFGRKREMLTAVMGNHTATTVDEIQTPLQPTLERPTHSIVIGAGVSGLMTAWALANRGIRVTLMDKAAPLSGASGNPRALLAPKMTPIHHVDEHLHTIGYLYSSRFYRKLNRQAATQNTPLILEPTGALEILVKSNVSIDEISDYPDILATTLSAKQAKETTGLNLLDLSKNLYLPQSGLVNPNALKDAIIKQPLITFQRLTVSHIEETENNVLVIGHSHNNSTDIAQETDNNEQNTIRIKADNVVICVAYAGHLLDSRIAKCRTIRGQLSWFIPNAQQRTSLPKLPLKYSGYCAPFLAQTGDDTLNNMREGQPQFLLGASFVDADTDTQIRRAENQQNRDKLITDIPELDGILPSDTENWQARAGVRTQTIDYHPLVGLLAKSSRIWTLSAMGAKGYALAPLCAESLADMMLGSFAPLSATMLAKISPNRARVHTLKQ